jgi:hypothetical protein
VVTVFGGGPPDAVGCKVRKPFPLTGPGYRWTLALLDAVGADAS